MLPIGRTSFRALVPEIELAANLLDRAADAHVNADYSLTESLIRQANLPVLREWIESIWGKNSPHTLFRAIPGTPGLVSRDDRVTQRMPSRSEKRALIERDGYHCRLCGTPVIRAEVRQYLHSRYPDALPWGRRNSDQHAAFQVLWLQYDHLLPHARGGSNAQDNMFIACAACNFGRMNYTLEEVGFMQPTVADERNTRWDGLERILAT